MLKIYENISIQTRKTPDLVAPKRSCSFYHPIISLPPMIK
jgi:hypothetical protein